MPEPRDRAGQEAVAPYGLAADVHNLVAQRIETERPQPVLDLGCGEGRLLRMDQTWSAGTSRRWRLSGGMLPSCTRMTKRHCCFGSGVMEYVRERP